MYQSEFGQFFRNTIYILDRFIRFVASEIFLFIYFYFYIHFLPIPKLNRHHLFALYADCITLCTVYIELLLIFNVETRTWNTNSVTKEKKIECWSSFHYECVRNVKFSLKIQRKKPSEIEAKLFIRVYLFIFFSLLNMFHLQYTILH